MLNDQAYLAAARQIRQRELRTCAFAGISAAAVWWALFGWDANEILFADHPDETLETAQLVLGSSLLILIGIWCGHRRSIVRGPGAAAAAFAVSCSITFIVAIGGGGAGSIASIISAASIGAFVFALVVVSAGLTKAVEKSIGLRSSFLAPYR